MNDLEYVEWEEEDLREVVAGYVVVSGKGEHSLRCDVCDVEAIK